MFSTSTRRTERLNDFALPWRKLGWCNCSRSPPSDHTGCTTILRPKPANLPSPMSTRVWPLPSFDTSKSFALPAWAAYSNLPSPSSLTWPTSYSSPSRPPCTLALIVHHVDCPWLHLDYSVRSAQASIWPSPPHDASAPRLLLACHHYMSIASKLELGLHHVMSVITSHPTPTHHELRDISNPLNVVSHLPSMGDHRLSSRSSPHMYIYMDGRFQRPLVLVGVTGTKIYISSSSCYHRS